MYHHQHEVLFLNDFYVTAVVKKKNIYIYIYIYTKNLTEVYGRNLLTDVNTTKSPCIVFINIYESIAQLQ